MIAATAGTTDTGSIDPLPACADIAESTGEWKNLIQSLESRLTDQEAADPEALAELARLPRPYDGAPAGAWLQEIEKSGEVRITDAVLERHLIWLGAEIAREKSMPIQFHIGVGDPDIELNKVDPSLLTPFIRAVDPWKFPITLLHCYPFQRQAGLMAENFPYVYFDVGFVLNWAGPGYQRIMDEAMELAPFTKQLYSSDAFGLSEFYYLGAMRFSMALRHTLDRWIADDELPANEAGRIMRLIAHDNAKRIYKI